MPEGSRTWRALETWNVSYDKSKIWIEYDTDRQQSSNGLFFDFSSIPGPTKLLMGLLMIAVEEWHVAHLAEQVRRSPIRSRRAIPFLPRLPLNWGLWGIVTCSKAAHLTPWSDPYTFLRSSIWQRVYRLPLNSKHGTWSTFCCPIIFWP